LTLILIFYRHKSYYYLYLQAYYVATSYIGNEDRKHQKRKGKKNMKKR